MKYKELQRYFSDRIFSFSELQKVTTETRESLKSQLQVMIKRGDVKSLKRGVYYLSVSKLNSYAVSNKLVKPSYLSLETALAMYQIIPDTISTYTAITSLKTQEYQNELGYFVYRHLPQDKFIGVTEQGGVLWASPEKALVDYLYLNSSRFKPTISSLQEARFQNLETLDFTVLRDFAKIFKQKKLIQIIELIEQYVKSESYDNYR